ncbi:MAG: hypothetical protein LBD37_00370 [Treponema sp.]|jgi:hypothetical protein|nr:hypothetical protein [Treponema sp.]
MPGPAETSGASQGDEAPRAQIPKKDPAALPAPAPAAALEGLFFQPEDVPELSLAPGVALMTADPRDKSAGLSAGEKQAVRESFCQAYIEGLLQDAGLAGVLGGDRVHGWPPDSPAAWVQNWRAKEPFPNSWGLASLILALGSIEGGQVSLVSGAILDQYGKIRGVGKPNGVLGYGRPLGNPFFAKGFAAQWFDAGLFLVRPQGDVLFIPAGESAVIASPRAEEEETAAQEPAKAAAGEQAEAPPIQREPLSEAALTAALPDAQAPAGLGAYTGGGLGEEALRPVFHDAWRAAALRRLEEPAVFSPDGPVYQVDLREYPWYLATGKRSIAIEGLYIQSFNQGKEVLILAESPGLPRRARFLGGPFLEALENAESGRIGGAEALSAEAWHIPLAAAGWPAKLLRGLAVYGLPLSDPLPRLREGVFVESQRFSKGWIFLGKR